MLVGIATDHGGFALKEELVAKLGAAAHEVVEFGAPEGNPGDDCPGYVVPLAHAVATGNVERRVAICRSGVGASVCADKVQGDRAALIHDHVSAKQGVEDDHMRITGVGGRTAGPPVAGDLLQTFSAAECSHADRHQRRLDKVPLVEAERISDAQQVAAAPCET
jgi:ribose 5-phosphate isomerase B